MNHHCNGVILTFVCIYSLSYAFSFMYNTKQNRFCFVFLSLIRPLAPPKVLSLGNKNKIGFVLYFSRLFVPLHPLFEHQCDDELSKILIYSNTFIYYERNYY